MNMPASRFMLAWYDRKMGFADYITMSVNGVVIPGGEPAPARRRPCNCDQEASVAVAESAPSDLDAD